MGSFIRKLHCPITLHQIEIRTRGEDKMGKIAESVGKYLVFDLKSPTMEVGEAD